MEYSKKTMRAVDHARDLWKQADAESRDLTPDERAEVEKAVDLARAERGYREFTDQFGGGPMEMVGAGGAYGDPGRRFIESAGYKSIQDPGARGQSFTTGAVDVGSLRAPTAAKGTLLEGAGAPGAGTGGGLV